MPLLAVLILALDGTQITLAVIGLLGIIFTALVAPLVLSSRGKIKTVERKAEQAQWDAAVVHQSLEEKIGTPNGRGNVVRMLEQIQEQAERTEKSMNKRMDLMDDRDAAIMALLSEHLKRYDRDHPALR